MIVADTSFVYAILDAADARHAEAVGWYRGTDEALATTPLVLAEIDHLAGARLGRRARTAFRADVGAGVYLVEGGPEPRPRQSA